MTMETSETGAKTLTMPRMKVSGYI